MATADSGNFFAKFVRFKISMHVSNLQLTVMKLVFDGRHWISDTVSVIQVTKQYVYIMFTECSFHSFVQMF